MLPTTTKKKSLVTNTKVMSGFMELTPDMQVEFDRIKRIIEESYCSFGFTQSTRLYWNVPRFY